LTDRCAVCDPNLGPILAESAHWRTVLNRNQNFLGKCFIATRRHIEDVTLLTADEWSDLHLQLSVMKRALDCSFQPDHYNFAFLQNQDRHVHLHVIPRYAGPRLFCGESFVDRDYPDHYSHPSLVRLLTDEQTAELTSILLRRMQSASTSNEILR
jgi:diadenosine tetraphosphate (Ap4A) HIT family hydrolase